MLLLLAGKDVSVAEERGLALEDFLARVLHSLHLRMDALHPLELAGLLREDHHLGSSLLRGGGRLVRWQVVFGDGGLLPNGVVQLHDLVTTYRRRLVALHRGVILFRERAIIV